MLFQGLFLLALLFLSFLRMIIYTHHTQDKLIIIPYHVHTISENGTECMILKIPWHTTSFLRIIYLHPRHLIQCFNFNLIGCSCPPTFWVPNSFCVGFILIILPENHVISRMVIYHFAPNILSPPNFITWPNIYLPPKLGGFKCICAGSCWIFLFQWWIFKIFYLQKPYWPHTAAGKYVTTAS